MSRLDLKIRKFESKNIGNEYATNTRVAILLNSTQQRNTLGWLSPDVMAYMGQRRVKECCAIRKCMVSFDASKQNAAVTFSLARHAKGDLFPQSFEIMPSIFGSTYSSRLLLSEYTV